jgi:hypothetical protein
MLRRVHFKDGQATNFGAGIRNTGKLTLESCIFTGNHTTTSASKASGAVYSDNMLTMRGCTFYGNTPGYRGGAVYFDGNPDFDDLDGSTRKTIILRGNLFYENFVVDSYHTVVISSGSLVDASYNAVDEALETSGWTAGTGDIQVTTGQPIDPANFKPYTGSPGITDIDILPASGVLNGFPITDFYGNSRNFPYGAAGGVEYGY